jgi:pimeloyl-ACP methyl ester carboxylesterase
MTRSVDYVFLHGGGQAGWVWHDTIAALHRQTGGEFGRAIALDAPGCGEKRGRNTAGLNVDDVVTDLLADISSSGLRDVVLVGHSQAGTILPRLVEKQPPSPDWMQRLAAPNRVSPTCHCQGNGARPPLLKHQSACSIVRIRAPRARLATCSVYFAPKA